MASLERTDWAFELGTLGAGTDKRAVSGEEAQQHVNESHNQNRS
jgi:hypothetical protein